MYLLFILLFLIFIFLYLIYQNTLPKTTITQEIINNNTLTDKTGENNEETLNNKKLPFLHDVYKIEVFNSREQAFKQAKKFLENNINGKLLRNISNSSIENNSLVSAVIPVYNSKNYILKGIRSIQNQNIMNLEIILVKINQQMILYHLLQKYKKKIQESK